MILFHEKFESNPDFICNYIKMKKEEEISKKLRIKLVQNDNKIVQEDHKIINYSNKIEPLAEIRETSSKKDIRIVRSNSNMDEIHKKKSIKTKNKNIKNSTRKVPENTPNLK